MGYEEIPVNVVNLKDLLKGEFHENALRKDFTITEAIAIKRAIEPEIEAEAKVRIKMTQFGNHGSSESDEPPTEHGRTDDKVAEYLGIGREKLRKMENIILSN